MLFALIQQVREMQATKDIQTNITYAQQSNSKWTTLDIDHALRSHEEPHAATVPFLFWEATVAHATNTTILTPVKPIMPTAMHVHEPVRTQSTRWTNPRQTAFSPYSVILILYRLDVIEEKNINNFNLLVI